MARAEQPSPGVNSVSARKSEMKGKKKTLTEVSIRKEASGYTVSESYENGGDPMSYTPSQRHAYSSAEEAAAHVSDCIAHLGEAYDGPADDADDAEAETTQDADAGDEE